MSTQICVVGTVATDPKFTKSPDKAAFCSFRLACNERRYDPDKQEWVDVDTSWFTVNAFRSLADHAFRSFQKGDRVIANGRLRTRDWSNEDKTGTSVIVDADGLGHDLRWGTSTFTKAAPAQTDHAHQSDAAPASSSGATSSSDQPHTPSAESVAAATAAAVTATGGSAGSWLSGAASATVTSEADAGSGTGADTEASAAGSNDAGHDASGLGPDGFTPIDGLAPVM